LLYLLEITRLFDDLRWIVDRMLDEGRFAAAWLRMSAPPP